MYLLYACAVMLSNIKIVHSENAVKYFVSVLVNVYLRLDRDRHIISFLQLILATVNNDICHCQLSGLFISIFNNSILIQTEKENINKFIPKKLVCLEYNSQLFQYE